jgi:hypothetical protein
MVPLSDLPDLSDLSDLVDASAFVGLNAKPLQRDWV